MKPLERLAQNKDEDVSIAALTGLARIAPRSNVLKQAIDRLTTTERDNDWATVIRLVSELAKASSRRILEDDPDERFRLAMSSRVIEQAIEKDIVFRLSSNFDDRSSSSLTISSRKAFTILYGVPSDLVQGAGGGALQELLQRSGSVDLKFAKVVRGLCLEADGRCWGVVRAGLDQGGRVVLRSGVELDKTSAPAGVVFRPATAKPDSEILLSWTDPAAMSKSGTLAKLVDSGKIQFEVATTRSISAGDRDNR